MFYNISYLELSNYILLFMLIYTRWLVMTLMIPFLGSAILPTLVRVALAAILSLLSFFMLYESTNYTNLTWLIIGALFIKEALIGFISGFFMSLIFYAYELLGQIIDIARAASMAKLLVPELKQQSSPMGTLLFQLALVLFFALDLHAPALVGLYQSFERFPPMSLSINLLNPSLSELSLTILGSIFELALRLALPIVFICFLIDLAFGFLNRIAPQINAYFLSLPAKMMGGLTMLFFLIPLLLDDFLAHQEQMLSFFKALLKY